VDSPPRRIRIEVCNMCQLKCPLCATPARKKDPGVVGWGYLKFEKFKDLIEKNPFIEEIEMSWLGEIFFNPDLSKIIKYSFKKGIALTANGGVNFNYVSQETLRDLVKYKVRSICVAIDGASQKTYSMYRVGGDIRKVISNIMVINKYKKQYNSYFPVCFWQFIIFGHNEHEILVAKKLSEKLGMKFYTKTSWDPRYSPVRDWQSVKKAVGKDFVVRNVNAVFYGKDEINKKCKALWEEPVINWNGDLFGCCENVSMSCGNVFENGLLETLNSEKFKYMKDMIEGKKPPNENIVCTQCPIFKNRNKRMAKK